MRLTLDESEDVGFLYPLPKARGRFFGVPSTSCIRRVFLEDLLPLPPGVGGSTDGILIAAGLRYGMVYLPDPLAAYRIHGQNAGFGNVASTQGTICMWEFLLAHPSFRRHLSDRHANLLRAKILERKAYLASRSGQQVFSGAWAGARVPLILAANGYRCNWKHLALPAACLLPIKRSPGERATALGACLAVASGEFISCDRAAMNSKILSTQPESVQRASERISIIIPTRNRSAILAQCLAALPAGRARSESSRSNRR